MYACCANCLSSTWIEPAPPTPGELRNVACGECAQSYVVNHARELGNTAAEQYRAMVKFANSNDIDMPSAYSVLLGVMPLAQAKAIRRNRAQAQPAPGPKVQPLPESLDPGFHRAVREGSLTIHDALHRGNREALAAALVDRHDLPKALAYDVADNRTSLRKAVRCAKKTRAAEEHELARPASHGVPALRKLIVLGVAALSLAVMTGISWTRSVNHRRPPAVREPVRPAAPAPAVAHVDPVQETASALVRATDVRTDNQGQVIEIVGPDPSSVLLSYCDAVPGFLGGEPLSIRNTVPAFREARLGLFRDYENGGAVRSIRIRRDSRSGRWIAGSGRAPIQASDASELPADASSIEVSKL
jgi:hypothetical protein